MLEFISSACIQNVRHHTELFEKSNKIREGKTHSNPATKNFVKPLQLSFCEERGEKFLLEKSPRVQTVIIRCVMLYNLAAHASSRDPLPLV